MNDMRAVIVPKSDQINADNLLGGPMTITITKVTIRPGTEQPVSIHFEGDDGKPYKPCKSMARVMVNLWGPDANEYVGRSMTLYCDPKVLWGGMAVGGIRISHMSHIPKATTMALTATKGNKKPFTVEPLKVAPPPAAEQTRRSVRDVLRDLLDTASTRADVEAAMVLPSVAKILKDGPENQRAILNAMIGEALARFPEIATEPENDGIYGNEEAAQ